MYQYLITEEQLREMVQYGQEHPNEEFYIEPLNDGSEIDDEFLSCSFWSYETDDNPADRTTGIWELSYGLMTNKQKWIPVSERLPEEIRTKGYGLCNVIVTHKCAGITRTSLAVFDKGKFYTNNNFKRNDTSVIAWMPLFEPYEEDNE